MYGMNYVYTHDSIVKLPLLFWQIQYMVYFQPLLIDYVV